MQQAPELQIGYEDSSWFYSTMIYRRKDGGNDSELNGGSGGCSSSLLPPGVQLGTMTFFSEFWRT